MAKNIFEDAWNTVQGLKTKAQQGIQNWAQANPQQATRIINAPQQIAQTYQKVSPYVPMAPRITTPQQIQTNFNNVRNFVPNTQRSIQNFAQNQPRITQQLMKLEQPVQRTSQFLQQPYKPVSLPQANSQYRGLNAGYNYVAKPLVEGLINFPTNYIGGITKTGLNIGQKAPLRKTLGSIGQTGSAIMDASVAGFGGKVVKNIANNALKSTLLSSIKSGVVSGLKYGGSYGFLSGLKDNQDIKDLLTYTKNVGGSTAVGGVGGAVVGGGIGGLAYGAGKIFGKLVNAYKTVNPKATDKEAASASTKFIRDEVGRFAKSDQPAWIKSDANTMAFRKAAGLPENGVRLQDMPMGNSIKAVTPEERIKLNQPLVQGGVGGGIPPQAPYKQKGNLLTSLTDRWVTSGRTVLNKMGKTGEAISSKIDNMYNVSERQVGTATDHYQKLTNGLDDAGVQRVSASLNGEKVPLNPQEQQASKGLRTILDTIWTKAKELGLNPGRKENYFPNIPNVEKLAANREATAKYFVDTKQISNVPKALSFIDDIINGADVDTAYVRLFGKARPKVSGFLEKNRIFEWPTQVIRTDRGVIPEYFQNTFSRINQVEQFGKNNDIGEKLLLDLTKQGYSIDAAKEILNQNLGLTTNNPIESKGLGIVRAVQSLMKMPLGAITNASQSVNTATVYGTRRTLKSIFNQVTGGGSAQESYALRTGAITDATMQEILDTWKGKGALAKFAAPGFGAVEKFNRIVSANVGADYATKLVKNLQSNPGNKGTINELTKLIGKFDVDSLLKGGLSEEQLLKAGQTATNVTQFKTRPIDMPSAWNSPMGKTLSQFKNFAFKQAGFIKNEVLAPATKGNFGPLSRYILLSILVGEGVNQVKGAVKGTMGAAYQTAKTGITERRLPTGEELGTAYEQGKGKPRPTDPGQRALQNFSSVGSFGLITDAMKALTAASQFGSRSILEFIAGPTGSDLARVATDVSELGQGKPRNLARNTIRSIPYVGQSISNIEYPKANDASSNMSIPDQLQKIKTGFELEPYKLQQQNAEVERGNTTDKIFAEIKDLPVDEAKKILGKYKADGTLTKEMYTDSLLPQIKEYKQGVSPSEKSVKSLGVDAEAKYYYDKTRNMSVEEKRTYLGGLKKRGVLTKPTYLQFLKLEKKTL